MKIKLNYKDGNVNGVAVNVADESFVISLHDAENGEEKDFDEWQQYYKQNNCRTFNRKQACIIAAYLDEINNKLVEAGGDRLDKWYWTSTEYSFCSAWIIYSGYGGIDCCSKYDAASSRLIE